MAGIVGREPVASVASISAMYRSKLSVWALTTPPSSDLRMGGDSGATLKKDMFPDEVGDRGEVGGGEPTNDLRKSSRKLNFDPDFSPPSAEPPVGQAGAVAGVGAVMVGG